MKFPFFGASNDDMGAADAYAYIGNVHQVDWNATEANRQIPLSEDVTLSDFKMLIDTAPGVGKTRTFTVRKNGVDTAATITISDTATSGSWSGSVSFTAGDLVSLKASSTGTPAAATNTYWHGFMNTVGMKTLLFGGNQNVAPNGAVNYSGPFVSHQWSTTNGAQDVPVPTGGTATKMVVSATAAPGASKSYAFSLRVNSTDALTCTVTGAGTTTASATGSQALAAGDNIQIKSNPSGTPTQAGYAWCVTFVPDNIGETICGFGTNSTASASATNFEQPMGTGAGWGAVESARLAKLPGVTIKKMYVRLGTAPGALASRTITWRDNSASSTLTVTVADPATTGSDTTHSVTHTADQPAGLQSTVSTPNPAASTIHVGYVILTAQPTQTITASGLASSAAVGSATVARGTVTVAPSGLASTAAVGSSTLTSVASIAPSGITSTAAPGSPVVAAGAVTVSPSGLASTAAAGAPTVTAVAYVSPAGIGTSAAIGNHTVANLSVYIVATGIGRTPTVGDSSVSSVAHIVPSGIGTSAVIGDHTVVPGGVTITPSGLASVVATGTPAVSSAAHVAPAGVASTAAIGSHTVVPGGVIVAPDGIGATSGTGSPVVTSVAYVVPEGVASTAAVGVASVGIGGRITPVGIPSNATVGVATVLTFAYILPTGIGRTPTFGHHRVDRQFIYVEAGSPGGAGRENASVFAAGREAGQPALAGFENG